MELPWFNKLPPVNFTGVCGSVGAPSPSQICYGQIMKKAFSNLYVVAYSINSNYSAGANHEGTLN